MMSKGTPTMAKRTARSTSRMRKRTSRKIPSIIVDMMYHVQPTPDLLRDEPTALPGYVRAFVRAADVLAAINSEIPQAVGAGYAVNHIERIAPCERKHCKSKVNQAMYDRAVKLGEGRQFYLYGTDAQIRRARAAERVRQTVPS